MKLSTSLVLVFVIVSFIGIASTSFVVYSQAEGQLRQSAYDHLESVSHAMQNNIATFLEGQVNKIELVANQQELSNEELSNMVNVDSSFYDMFVIDSSGVVVASSNPERIGLDRSNRSYFVNARNQSYISPVYFALVPGQYSIAVSTPFHNGVLVGAMKLDVLEKIVSDRSGMGQTGETLLAFRDDKNETVYFTSRLFSDKKFEVVPYNNTAIPMFRALNGEDVFISSSKDYRGVNVISVSEYLDKINVGMVSKIDESEAVGVGRSRLINSLLIVLIVAIIVVSILGIYVSRRITGPIKKLSADVDEITRGRLDIQLEKSRIFEIQELINSLNRILASMKLAILRTNISRSELGLGEAIKQKEEVEGKYNEIVSIVENSQDAIIGKTLDGIVTSWNRASENLYGYKKEEMIGKSIFKIVPRRLHAEVKDILDQIAKGKTVEHFETVRVRKDGKEISVEISVSPIKKEDKIVGASVIARDISKQKESENRYNVLVENASDEIFVIDENYRYVSANKVTLKTLEKKPEELIGKTVSEALPKKMSEQFMKNLKSVFRTGKALLTEEEISLPSGKVKASTKLSPIKDEDGKVKSILGIVRIIPFGEENKSHKEIKK